MIRKRAVILTGSELRHTFLRKYVALDGRIDIVRSYCEGLEKSLDARVDAQEDNALRKEHLAARAQSERDFFELFVETTPDSSRPLQIPAGAVNEDAQVAEIRRLAPDLLVAYGCSMVREPLLSAFAGRFLNVHLGLSPYYRGAGTNYWPLVNGEPEYVGATFMHIDAGVDTGEIIHQIRARIFSGDTAHQIGNRLIVDTAKTYCGIIARLGELKRMPQLQKPAVEHYYKNKDFTEESVVRLRENLRVGLLDRYAAEAKDRSARAPIIANPAV